MKKPLSFAKINSLGSVRFEYPFFVNIREDGKFILCREDRKSPISYPCTDNEVIWLYREKYKAYDKDYSKKLTAEEFSKRVEAIRSAVRLFEEHCGFLDNSGAIGYGEIYAAKGNAEFDGSLEVFMEKLDEVEKAILRSFEANKKK